MFKKLDMIILEIFLLYNAIVSRKFKKNKLQLKWQSKNKSYLMRVDWLIPLNPTGKEMWGWSLPFMLTKSCVTVVIEMAVCNRSLSLYE